MIAPVISESPESSRVSVSEFRDLATELGIKGDRFELAWTRGGGYQASVRVGRAIHIGIGPSEMVALEECLSKAQLGKGWIET